MGISGTKPTPSLFHEGIIGFPYRLDSLERYPK